MPAPNPPSTPSGDRITISCLYCHRRQEVARLAMSVTCKFCYKPLKIEGIAIKQYEARRLIATCGVVTVEKNGNVISDAIKCGSMIVRGRVKGAIESQGPVRIGPKADVRGDVTAPTLEVDSGAVLDGQYEIGPKAIEVSDPAG